MPDIINTKEPKLEIKLGSSADKSKYFINDISFDYAGALGFMQLQGKSVDEANKILQNIFEAQKQNISNEKDELKKKQDKKITEVLNSLGDLPFKVKYEDETLIVCIVSDKENHIIEPTATSEAAIKTVFKSKPTLREFIYKFADALKENDIIIEDMDDVINLILDRSTKNAFTSRNMFIDEFKTFSFNKDEWKISYIDPLDIENSDDNTSSWDSFGDSLASEEFNKEAYDLFKAWCWTIFDERAINHNRQALWLYGEGYDGKSVVTKVLSSILAGKYEKSIGSDSIGIGQLDRPFWATSFYGKSLVIINEVGDSDLFSKKANDGPGGKLHQITGHDLVAVEAKGKQPFSARIKSRILLFANCAPTFNSMQNNEITRIIPIHVSKTYFDGLEVINKDFVYSDWGKELYEQRFAFLKKCKEAYNRIVDPKKTMISITKNYQEEYFIKSEGVARISSFMENYIEKTEDEIFYTYECLERYIKFAFNKLYDEKPTRFEITKILEKNTTKLKKFISADKRGCVFKCKLDKEMVESFNATKVNEKEKIHLFVPFMKKSSLSEKLDSLTQDEISLPKDFKRTRRI